MFGGSSDREEEESEGQGAASGEFEQGEGEASGSGWEEAAFERSDGEVLLSKMSQHNELMIRLGRLAMERGESERVRSYGHRIAADYQFAKRKVIQVARDQKALLGGVPEESVAEEENPMVRVDELEALQAAEFDAQFIAVAGELQRQWIRLLVDSSEDVQSPPLKNFLEKLIPVLQQDVTLVQQLRHSLNGEGKREANEHARRASAE